MNPLPRLRALLLSLLCLLVPAALAALLPACVTRERYDAVEVARFLIARGVAPGELSAAGYGEFDPVSDNASAEGKARNRRIEITVVPSIDEMVKVPAR